MATTPDLPLQGLAILATRPAAQADDLCGLIRAAGGTPVNMPLLEIVPVADPRAAAAKLAAGSRWDWLVFVSANAVRHALDLPGWHGQADRPRVAAIGGATERALRAAGITVDLVPKPQSNSDALLATPEMAEVAGLKFLIVRGEGGRERLAEGLAARGATAEYAELYRRVAAPVSPDILARGQRGELDAVVLTSGESLECLMELLGEAGADWAESLPLAVMSDRIAEQARSRGWRRVAVAEETSDRGLVAALVRIFQDAASVPHPPASHEYADQYSIIS